MELQLDMVVYRVLAVAIRVLTHLPSPFSHGGPSNTRTVSAGPVPA